MALAAAAGRGHLQLDDRNRRGVRVSKSYVIRILRLALLASGFVEAILSARAYQSVVLDRLEQPLPVGWDEQP